VNGSLWLETAPDAPVFGRLEGDVTADVCVIGGGIAGITTALLLHEAGARVVVLEANRVGHGVTGHTTAKVSSQHGLIYAQLRGKHGADVARGYGQANEAALAWIAARVERDGIECDFRRRASYAYVTAPDQRSEIEDEVRAAVEAGLPASLVETTPLPFPVAAAVTSTCSPWRSSFPRGRSSSARTRSRSAAPVPPWSTRRVGGSPPST
jgi:glycine/D-amino acid oxidase-like deaminating enzyme